MIAVVVSALLGLYIFLPDFLFRKLAFNFRTVTKTPTGRFEEVLSGAEIAFLPFIFSLVTSKIFWWAGHWPGTVEESVAAKYSDYRTVISSLCSDAYFHDHMEQAWTALGHVWLYQLRFLFWMYTGLGIEILGAVLLTYYFGSLSRYPVYRWTFGKVFLGRASHWEVLLTGFAFPPSSRPSVEVDAMTTDDHLYAGKVEDYFLKADGELSGLLLKDFRRFKFKELQEDRRAGLKPDAKKYWKDIPGANFYLPADKIANLNIRYETRESELILDVERLLKGMGLPKGLTVSLENSASNESRQEPDDTPGPSGDVNPQ